MLSPEDATVVQSGQRHLASLLMLVALIDQPPAGEDVNYARRNELVIEALYVADRIGLSAGVRLDPEQPAWPVVFIELPDGQVSWHLPEYEQAWDGHTTAQKYLRVAAFVSRAYLGERGK